MSCPACGLDFPDLKDQPSPIIPCHMWARSKWNLGQVFGILDLRFEFYRCVFHFLSTVEVTPPTSDHQNQGFKPPQLIGPGVGRRSGFFFTFPSQVFNIEFNRQLLQETPTAPGILITPRHVCPTSEGWGVQGGGGGGSLGFQWRKQT